MKSFRKRLEAKNLGDSVQIKTETGYDDALNLVVNTRVSRKKVYGDSWKDMKDYELVAQIVGKSKRLEHMLFNGNSSYESMSDSCIDLANYAMFLLQKKIEEKDNGDGQRDSGKNRGTSFKTP
jgi:hypothetical protein